MHFTVFKTKIRWPIKYIQQANRLFNSIEIVQIVLIIKTKMSIEGENKKNKLYDEWEYILILFKWLLNCSYYCLLCYAPDFLFISKEQHGLIIIWLKALIISWHMVKFNNEKYRWQIKAIEQFLIYLYRLLKTIE